MLTRRLKFSNQGTLRSRFNSDGRKLSGFYGQFAAADFQPIMRSSFYQNILGTMRKKCMSPLKRRRSFGP
jgi:hypothetical protein